MRSLSRIVSVLAGASRKACQLVPPSVRSGFHWVVLLAAVPFLIPKGVSDVMAIVIELQAFAFSLALLMLWSRQVSFRIVCFAVGLTASIEMSLFFQNFLHPALIKFHLYPDWFGRGSVQQQSAQYARVLVGWVVALLLLALVVAKQTRTLDRIMVCLMTFSVLLTALLFHYITVAGVKLPEAIRRGRWI